MSAPMRGSVTRIAELPEWPLPCEPVDRNRWRAGDYVLAEVLAHAFLAVLVVGTSMSAGKTSAARVAVRELKRLGHEVIGAKLTGAGRWHDTLAMRDAGADHTFDFIDAGLPTTVCPPDEYREAVGGLLRRMAATGAAVAVIEAGASPLEPYNGGTLVGMLGDDVAFTILAASDPYAVLGIERAWERSFDLVTGPTSNTKAGVQLVHALTGLPSLDLLDPATHGSVRRRLEAAVGAGRDA